MEEIIISQTERLLRSIDTGDYKTYKTLVAEDLTCFEPEAGSNLVTGMAFHETFFNLPRSANPPLSSLSNAKVRLLTGGRSAVISYVRLTQVTSGSGVDIKTAEETRVWELRGGKWMHVHFHRSQNVKAELKDSGVYSPAPQKAKM